MAERLDRLLELQQRTYQAVAENSNGSRIAEYKELPAPSRSQSETRAIVRTIERLSLNPEQKQSIIQMLHPPRQLDGNNPWGNYSRAKPVDALEARRPSRIPLALKCRSRVFPGVLRRTRARTPNGSNRRRPTCRTANSRHATDISRPREALRRKPRIRVMRTGVSSRLQQYIRDCIGVGSSWLSRRPTQPGWLVWQCFWRQCSGGQRQLDAEFGRAGFLYRAHALHRGRFCGNQDMWQFVGPLCPGVDIRCGSYLYRNERWRGTLLGTEHLWAIGRRFRRYSDQADHNCKPFRRRRNFSGG
jgi:hypothetical protein